jgi:cytosine deaminase
MPYGRDDEEKRQYAAVYRHIIQKALDKYTDKLHRKFTCERFDEDVRSGPIAERLYERLASSDVVIADISGSNPNVMYEVGIRHGRRHGTILVANARFNDAALRPFDLAHVSIIYYEDVDAPGGNKKAIADIQRCLRGLLDGTSARDSPPLRVLLKQDRDGSGKTAPSVVDHWIERVDRGTPGVPNVHFSIFSLEFASGPLDPFLMRGFSFDASGAFHSRWETKYLRVKSESHNEVMTEYVYRSWIVGERWPRSGFGMCRFGVSPHTGGMTTGSGFYLAGEEPNPQRRNYELRRLDEGLRRKLKIGRLVLDEKQLARIVPALASELGTGPVAADPLFLAASPGAGQLVRSRAVSPAPRRKGMSPASRRGHAQPLTAAIAEAKKGWRSGGIPIGSVLSIGGTIVGRGYNRRVQEGNPILHGEMDCLRNAGRLTAADYRRSVLYTTLSPCAMCTGAILLYRIPVVVIGEHDTFLGREDLLRAAGVEVIVLDDARCIAMMKAFIAAKPALWNEDIGEPGRGRRLSARPAAKRRPVLAASFE